MRCSAGEEEEEKERTAWALAYAFSFALPLRWEEARKIYKTESGELVRSILLLTNVVTQIVLTVLSVCLSPLFFSSHAPPPVPPSAPSQALIPRLSTSGTGKHSRILPLRWA